MKILFVIHSSGRGIGGHYHSLYHVSLALSELYEVHVVSIGKTESPVVVNHPRFYKHIYCEKSISYVIKANKEFSKINEALEVDIIHFFDAQALNFLMLNKYIRRKKVALSKCGGPNSVHANWQHADAIFNQSLENHNWFKNNKYYQNELLFHIPNRVTTFKYEDLSRFGKRDEQHFTFLRVSRIGRRYEKTFYDTCNLIRFLKDKHKIRFILVGKVQDESIFSEMKAFVDENVLPVEFITDDRANNGKQSLYLADAVVGTGRSLMEALSKNLPVLTPLSNADLPILVTEDNFSTLLKSNFSQRNRIPNYDKVSEASKIEKLMTDKEYYTAILNQMKGLYNDEVGEKGLKEKYKEAYNKLLKHKRNQPSFYFPNLIYFLKYGLIKR